MSAGVGPKLTLRRSRRNATVLIELENGTLIPVLIVPRNTSKYNPKECEREKSRREQQEQQAS